MTKTQEREAFLRHRVERRDGHLIWLGKTSLLTGAPVGFFQGSDKMTPGYVITYKVLRGQDVSGREQTCDELLCVDPEHWRKAAASAPKRRNRKGGTHCGNGHEWAVNERLRANGQRWCAACQARPVATHCIRGHDWSTNRRVNSKGYQFCITCRPHLEGT